MQIDQSPGFGEGSRQIEENQSSNYGRRAERLPFRKESCASLSSVLSGEPHFRHAVTFSTAFQFAYYREDHFRRKIERGHSAALLDLASPGTMCVRHERTPDKTGVRVVEKQLHWKC